MMSRINVFVWVTMFFSGLNVAIACKPVLGESNTRKEWIKRLNQFKSPADSRTHEKISSAIIGEGMYVIDSEKPAPNSGNLRRGISIDESVSVEGLLKLPVTTELFSGGESQLLERCKQKKCDIKFSDLELNQITSKEYLDNSGHKSRASLFLDFIFHRIVAFRERGDIFSYEDSTVNRNLADPRYWPGDDFIVKSGSVAHDLSSVGGWNLMVEVLNPFPNKHKPAVNFSARKCVSSGGTVTCREVSLYSNHYFDAWEKWYQIQSLCIEHPKEKHVTYYEIMDIDQLKGNPISRAVLSVQMRKLMKEHTQAVLLERKMQ